LTLRIDQRVGIRECHVQKKVDEPFVEATIKTLATKDDIANIRKEMGEIKADTIKWMFFFWVGQVGAILAVAFIFLKK